MEKEGIVEAKNLAEFDRVIWKQVTDNLWHPGSQIKNLDKGTDKDSTILQTPFVFGTKTQKILLKVLELMRYYKMVGQILILSGVKYNPVIKSFTNQWKGLTDQKKDTQAAVSKITTEFPLMH
eukprot:2207178-Ditylum_brightwellii.AAC.1